MSGKDGKLTIIPSKRTELHRMLDWDGQKILINNAVGFEQCLGKIGGRSDNYRMRPSIRTSVMIDRTAPKDSLRSRTLAITL